jgi:hypothetical protein
VLFIFITSKYYNLNQPFNIGLLIKQTTLFLVCLTSVFVLDFLAGRNNLTKKNSYKILIFTVFIALLPETILNSKLLLANLFILFALRRIVSLRTKKEIKKKLFDAAFWISLAAIFYFWAILFYVLIIFGLILYSVSDIKNWIIPLVGTITITIIWASYMIVTNQDVFHYFDDLITTSFDFTQLDSRRKVVATTLILSYGLWSLIYFIRYLNTKSKKSRPSYIIIIIATVVGLLIVAIAPNKNGSEFLFLFAPLSIIITNYLETIVEKWFKEALILGLILTPIMVLFL